ncbi:MAG: hypothetical protein IKD80_03150 [Selenomonadaceae bacterium]|nr:hypothetical protein [Selenomonadaceae bacterium]
MRRKFFAATVAVVSRNVEFGAVNCRSRQPQRRIRRGELSQLSATTSSSAR